MPFIKKTFRYLGYFALPMALMLCCSFDWPIQTNQVLRQEMLSFTSTYLKECKDPKAAKPIRRFFKQQQQDTASYAWIPATHKLVERLKGLFPPSLDNQTVRRFMLQLLDYPLHVNNVAKEASAQELDAYYQSAQHYLNTARHNVLDQMEAYDGVGTAVRKVYNSGYIIQRHQLTVGIDLSDRPAMPNNYTTWTSGDYERMARGLDILFITHPHDDHYSLPLIKEMIKAGKPVVTPWAFTVPENHPYRDSIQQITSLPGADTLLHVLNRVYTTPIQIAGIEIASYPGNQGEGIPCNVYWIAMDGFQIIHNGDNYDRKAEAMLATLPAARLILGASWNDPQALLANAMKAPGASAIRQIYIPSHENELGHGVSNRESYHELFTRADRLNNPDFTYPTVLLLDNGESFTLQDR